MKMSVRFFIITSVLFCFPLISNAQAPGRIIVYGLKGSSGVALLRMFESPPQAPGYSITLQTLSQADIMAALFISGEAKIGILPPNIAAKIASSGGKIQIAAVTGTGMLTLLSGDANTRRIEDLKGKTVEIAGQGATPDFVFRKIAQSKNMIVGKDITPGYALAYPEMALAIAAGRIQFALLPEPWTTMALIANNKLRAIGDIQYEWMRLTENQKSGAPVGRGIAPADNYPMTALVVDRDFAAANGALIGIILESVKNSIEWVTAHPVEAGLLAEKYELGLKAQIVQAAIPKSNYVFIPLPQARAGLEKLFKVFLEFAPASIGGTLPGDDFYWTNSRLAK